MVLGGMCLVGKRIKKIVILLIVLTGLIALRVYGVSNEVIDTNLTKGKYYLSISQYQEALDQFDSILTTTADTAVYEEALYYKGYTLLLMRRDKEALQYLKLYVEKYPKGKYVNAVSLFYKGFKSQMEDQESVYGKLLENPLIGIPFTIGYIIMWIYVMMDIRKTNLPSFEKAIWVALQLFVPLIGMVLYFWAKHYRKFSRSW